MESNQVACGHTCEFAPRLSAIQLSTRHFESTLAGDKALYESPGVSAMGVSPTRHVDTRESETWHTRRVLKSRKIGRAAISSRGRTAVINEFSVT